MTYPLELFRRDVIKIPSRQLVNLIDGIYQLKWDMTPLKLKGLSDEAINDLERKETIIEAELMRRNFLNKTNYQDFQNWKKKMNFKRRAYFYNK